MVMLRPITFLCAGVSISAGLSCTVHEDILDHTCTIYVYIIIMGSFTLHFGLKYEIIYELDAIENLFVSFQLDIFRAYTPIFRNNGCYNFFTYAAYGVLGVVRCRS